MRLLSLPAALLLTLACAAQWTMLPVPPGGRHDDIFFLDALEGWTCDGEGKIHHTTDGGDSWELQYASATGEYLRCIEFIDPDTGFCGTLDGTFLKTTDGGETWTDIMPLLQQPVPGICGLSIPSPQVVCGVGIWHTPGYFVRSTDAGHAWTHTDMTAQARALVDVLFISDLEGWATGMAETAAGGGVILHTVDGGQTWTEQFRTNVSGEYIWKIQSPDGNLFVASIDGNPTVPQTRYVRSDDGGATWHEEVALDAYRYVQGIGFVTPFRGWIGADNSLLETLDGGATWNEMVMGGGHNRFWRVNDSLMFLSSYQVFRWDGPFTTPVQEPGKASAMDDLKVSPNPTTGRITVEAWLARPSRTKLHVYDAQARLLATFVDERLPQGRSVREIDLGTSPPGTYVMVLHTNDGQVYRRVVRTD